MANRIRFFHIGMGPRGMYMPDSSFIIAAKSRRELKSIIESEAYDLPDAGFVGASKKAIASLAARAWRNSGIYDSVMPLKPGHADSYCYGLMVSNSTRADFEQQESENE